MNTLSSTPKRILLTWNNHMLIPLKNIVSNYCYFRNNCTTIRDINTMLGTLNWASINFSNIGGFEDILPVIIFTFKRHFSIPGKLWKFFEFNEVSSTTVVQFICLFKIKSGSSSAKEWSKDYTNKSIFRFVVGLSRFENTFAGNLRRSCLHCPLLIVP